MIADILAGRDVLAQSPTGSGKTLAFAVPLSFSDQSPEMSLRGERFHEVREQLMAMFFPGRSPRSPASAAGRPAAHGRRPITALRSPAVKRVWISTNPAARIIAAVSSTE